MRPPEIVKTLPYSARATVKEGRYVPTFFHEKTNSEFGTKYTF